MSQQQLIENAVDANEIAARTTFKPQYLGRVMSYFPWWPKPIDRMMNSGRWWLWADVVQALDEHRPDWRDRARKAGSEWADWQAEIG